MKQSTKSKIDDLEAGLECYIKEFTRARSSNDYKLALCAAERYALSVQFYSVKTRTSVVGVRPRKFANVLSVATKHHNEWMKEKSCELRKVVNSFLSKESKDDIRSKFGFSKTTIDGAVRNVVQSLSLLDDRETQDTILRGKVYGLKGGSLNTHQLSRELFLSTYVVSTVLYDLRFEDYKRMLKEKYS